MKIEGKWPKDCPQRAFVDGAAWWQFKTNGATMFSSERREAEAEAIKRFGQVSGIPEREDIEESNG